MIKKSVAALLPVLLLLLCVGCGEQGTHAEDQAAVTAVVGQLFTAPDKELEEAMDASMTVAGAGVPSGQAGAGTADALLEKRYGASFTGDALSTFATTYALSYPIDATRQGYTLKAGKVTVEAAGDSYTFAVSVSYGAQGGEQGKADITGSAQCTAEHKISYFRIQDDGGLSEKLKA